MGKVIASYLLKVHVHAPDGDDDAPAIAEDELTNDQVIAAAVVGIGEKLGGVEISVSQIDRVDE